MTVGGVILKVRKGGGKVKIGDSQGLILSLDGEEDFIHIHVVGESLAHTRGRNVKARASIRRGNDYCIRF